VYICLPRKKIRAYTSIKLNVGILMDEFRESKNLDIVRKLNRVIKVYFEKRNSGPAYKAKRNIIDY
jgi:hypothetical protein